MFLVLDYVYMKMKKDLDRKILLIDEAWSLLSRTEDAGYIFEIVKTCRKYNLGLLLINQEVEGLLTSHPLAGGKFREIFFALFFGSVGINRIHNQ